MKKVLSPIAFVVLLVAISANILNWLISLIFSLVQLLTQDFQALLAGMGYGDFFDDATISAIIGVAYFFVAIAYIWAFALNGYFLYRIIRNRTIAQRQGYLIFMFVLHILGVIFNGFSLLIGIFNPTLDLLTTLFVLGINILVIVGYSIQSGYKRSQNLVYGNPEPKNEGFIDNNSYVNRHADPFSDNNNPFDNNNPYNNNPYNNNSANSNPYNNGNSANNSDNSSNNNDLPNNNDESSNNNNN